MLEHSVKNFRDLKTFSSILLVPLCKSKANEPHEVGQSGLGQYWCFFIMSTLNQEGCAQHIVSAAGVPSTHCISAAPELKNEKIRTPEMQSMPA